MTAPLSAKDALRARLLAARKAMSASDRDGARTAIRLAVLERCRSRSWGCVAAYQPWTTEPGSLALLEELVDAGVRVIVPVTLPDHDLDWVAWPEPAPTQGRHAVAEADAVLVPALAVAPDGTRLGRGRGSYDRALARCPASSDIAAVVFDGEVLDDLPADDWDVPVRAFVSPSGWTNIVRNTAARPGD